jgi:hypothetical protein
MKKNILLVCTCFLLCHFAKAQSESISLAGTWTLKLDSMNVGLQQKWYDQSFSQQITLPGTLDDAGIGATPSLSTDSLYKAVLMSLTRRHRYVGVAWYKKEIEVPESFAGRDLQLSLERVIWKTTLWIDGEEIGSNESLSAAQLFNIRGGLKAGKHSVVLRIDNNRQHDISVQNFAHAYTDGTQIMWNGVIGKLELKSIPAISIQRVQVYPDVANKQARVELQVYNSRGNATSASVLYSLLYQEKEVANKKSSHTVNPGNNIVTATIAIDDVKLWDEFTPNLYSLKTAIQVDQKVTDGRTVAFGMREWKNDNALLHLNNRRVFMRGTLECNIFPLSGHPPMERSGWVKVFSAARQYGLNHLRFHSWCPPQAAFEVADSLGFYLQIELPLWALKVGEDKPTLDFLQAEAQQIIAEYGNHPSFCFWSIGNELEGDYHWLTRLVKNLKSQDNRHLYTTSTFSFQKNHGRSPEPEDQYYITQYTKNGWVRGQGIFNDVAPDFKTDYTKSLKDFSVPLITHEVGQYSVYPVISEIDKYTGVLDPLNFKAIKKDLERKNMLPLAPLYTEASGKLAVNLYKEEIERALKTPGASGFELLDLHDFPGQGTALVGILDAFWDSKGLITPEAFKKFCSPVVPLLRFEKAIYTNDEIFQATAEVANFSNNTFNNVNAEWDLIDVKGKVIASGKLAQANVAIGNGNALGEISFALAKITSAQKLTVVLKFKGNNAEYGNEWNIWVYPKQLSAAGNKNIIFTKSVDEAVAALQEGKTVLLNPDTAVIKGAVGRFTTVFWSPVHFPDQPGSMGLLCDAGSAAFNNFPTDVYTNWQWWDLVTRSKTVVVNDIYQNITPLVSVVDNFYKNRRLADVFEAKVGNGKLIFCSMDISADLEKRPAARQLRYSLLQYAASKRFAPVKTLDENDLRNLVK